MNVCYPNSVNIIFSYLKEDMDVDRSIFFVIFIFIFDLLLLPFFSFDIDQRVHHIMFLFLFLIEATAISFLQLDAL